MIPDRMHRLWGAGTQPASTHAFFTWDMRSRWWRNKLLHRARWLRAISCALTQETIMTKLVLPLLLTACVSTEPATESQRDQAVSPGGYHEVFRGTEATVNFADLATRISIDVFENGSNQFPGETYLFYSFSVADPSSQVCRRRLLPLRALHHGSRLRSPALHGRAVHPGRRACPLVDERRGLHDNAVHLRRARLQQCLHRRRRWRHQSRLAARRPVDDLQQRHVPRDDNVVLLAEDRHVLDRLSPGARQSPGGTRSRPRAVR